MTFEGPALEENEFQRLARFGLPLILPWHHEPIRIGASYHTAKQTTCNPWAKDTPFDLDNLKIRYNLSHPESGSTCSFRMKTTSTSATTDEHLSLGLGVSVAPLPIITLSVKGTYDHRVQENRDSSKTSLQATCRVGCVDLVSSPTLNQEAIGVIRNYGMKAFFARYGDYYVAGYRLGGDTGLLISGSGSARNHIDGYDITNEAKTLFSTIAGNWGSNFEQRQSACSLRLLGYDTLEGRSWKNDVDEKNAQIKPETWPQKQPFANSDSLREDAQAVFKRSQSLAARVTNLLDGLGVRSNSQLTFHQCEALIRSGVVVELLLMPMVRLRDVAQWKLFQDIL